MRMTTYLLSLRLFVCSPKMIKWAGSLCLILLLPGFGFGQACCSGGSPLAGTLGLQSMPSGSGLLEVNYDYNTQHDLVEGSKELGDNPRRRNTHSVLLRGVYAFTDRTSIFGILSLIRQEDLTKQLSGGSRLKYAEGLGDAILFGQYALQNRLDRQILIGGGVKIPLGSVGEIDPETGLPLHPDLQPGTGSWDILFGARISWQHVLKQNLQLTSNLTYRLTAPADRYLGRQKYEFGDELRWLTGLSDSYLLGGGIWNPSLFLLYRFTQIDRTNDLDTPNTGGHWVHIRPGLGYAFSPSFSVNTFGEIPLYRQLKGTQLTTTFRFRLSLSYFFSGNKTPEPIAPSGEWRFE